MSPLQASMLRGRPSGQEWEQVIFLFKEGLAEERVREAWQETVDATEALCRGVGFRNGQIAGWEPRVPKEVLTVCQEEPVAGWEAWLQEDRHRDFAWADGVPWRAVYWPHAGRWVWTFHHALLDGRSMTRILRAFLQRLKGEEGPVLRWRPWRPATEAEKAAAAAHWARWPIVERGERLDFAATSRGRARRILGSTVLEQLEAVALETGVTAATVVLWAWGQANLLASGAKATVLGQVRAGAPAEGTAGFGMNTLPVVVTRPAAEEPVAPSWRALREQVQGLRAFEALAPEDIAVLPGAARQAAEWDSVVMIERGTLWHQLGDDAVALLQQAELREETSSPLLASAYLRPDLLLEVEAAAPLGQPGAEALVAYWAAVLQRCAASAQARVHEVIRLPEETARWLAQVGDGGPPLEGPAHLAEAWRGVVQVHANRLALWSPEKSWTYAEVHHRAENLALDLQKAGVRAGQAVVAHPPRRADWLIVLTAVALLGAVYLPLGHRVPSARMRGMVRDSQAEVLVGVAPENVDLGLRTVPCPENASSPPVQLPAPPLAPLALLYTSGSTGQPKGVPVEHHGALNEARWAAQALGLGPGDRLLQFAAPGFDAALEEMLACALSGATLVPRPEHVTEDLAAFHAFLETAGITALDLPTAFWSEWTAWMKAHQRRVPASIKATIIGGERASAQALAQWQSVGGGTLWNSYGPTEASIVATAAEISAYAGSPQDPPIGRPLPGYLVHVVNEHGELMPPGAVGEIWIGGPGVASGYWRRPDLTAAAFVEKEGVRWYRTGDLGYWDAQGLLHFAGRRDDQLKIRGHRVEPEEAARLIERFPGVAGAYVGLAGPSDHRRLTAWVRWAEPPPSAWPNALRRHLADELPPAAIPVHWMAVEAFPLTERGKIDRAALPEPELSPETGEPPVTPTERRLAQIWRGVLGVDHVSRQDSFFELGGDSLSALRLFGRLVEDFGVQLPMASLMQAPTLQQLAEVIDQRAQTAAMAAKVRPAPYVVPLSETNGKPPLFCIHGGDGGVFFYRELARHLPEGLSLVTIESSALSAEVMPEIQSVEASAKEYVAAILRHQAQGPYYLAGYSYGGVLVYEIARQLRAAGEQVAFLALFDTQNPACSGRAYTWRERLQVFRQAHAHLSPRQQWLRLLNRVRQGVITHVKVRLEKVCAQLARHSQPHSWLRALQVREAHSRAMDAYCPRTLDVPLVLFKASTVDDKYATPEDYGWTGLPAALEIATVPGSHLDMFTGANAAYLARELVARLQRREESNAVKKTRV